MRRFWARSLERWLEAQGVVCGDGPRVRGQRPWLDVEGKMVVGRSWNLHGEQTPVFVKVASGATLRIGDGVLLNQGAMIVCAESITIGDHAKISNHVAIRDTDAHEIEPGRGAVVKPVHIGRNALIGHGAIVMPGVTVGDNGVVAAGAVVTRDVPQNSIAAGVPATIVRRIPAPPEDYVRP